MTDHLRELGWNTTFRDAMEKDTALTEGDFKPARVILEHRNRYTVAAESGEYSGEITGRLRFKSDEPTHLPKVGDWVMVNIFPESDMAVIHSVLPRRTKLSRKQAGETTEEQIIATNIDYVLIMQSLDQNFNLRRLERYIVMVKQGGSTPLIVLNKTDVADDVEQRRAEVSEIFPEVPAHPICSLNQKGILALQPYLKTGCTLAVVGSSGVGKSTLINTICGKELFETNPVRGMDNKGRHTTTRRELVVVPDGGILIDTPGMREFHLWTADDALEDSFDDILDYTDDCKFNDCSHTHEIECAVKNAIEAGELEEHRYQSFLKLVRELQSLEERKNTRYRRDSERKLTKLYRRIQDEKDRF